MNKIQSDFRRATMLVNDIETPLKIYRDILGMKVYYDKEIVVTGKFLPAGKPNSKTRLVILQCNDSHIGMLGILQYIDPPLPPPPPRPRPNRVQTGEAVFIIHNEDVSAAYKKLRDVKGVEIIGSPDISEYPKDGGGVFRVLGFSFFDPNGYFIELNQFI